MSTFKTADLAQSRRFSFARGRGAEALSPDEHRVYNAARTLAAFASDSDGGVNR